MRASYLFTSESVAEGHPDKVCDRISDEIVDLVYREAAKTGVDPWTVRIACETLATTNRVGASRLQNISSILNVPVSFFFEDAPGEQSGAATGMAEASSSNYVVDFLSSSEGLQLNRAFVKIADPKVRRRLVDLVKALAADAEAE